MKWSTGICGCFEDWSICCVTTFLPCVTFGRVAEHAENEDTSCCAQGCLYVLSCMFEVLCICGCFEDCSICCETTFLPCVTFGEVAEHAENNNTSCCAQGCLYVLFCMFGVPCLYTCIYRRKLREKYGLPEEPCGDCCVHWCCDCCALCQEAREIKIRMANTPKGWASRVMAAPHVIAGMFK